MKDKKYETVIKKWIDNSYVLKNILNNQQNQQNYTIFLTLAREDLLEFKNFVESQSDIRSWEHLWIHLVQHLSEDIGLSEKLTQYNLQYGEYVTMLKQIIQEYMISYEYVCGKILLMNKSRVEHEHAMAKEEEASTHFNQDLVDVNAKYINFQDKSRGSGRYEEGNKTHYKIQAVPLANIPEQDDGFDEAFVNNFDNGLDDI